MSQYIETIYLAFKTFICFAGYLASIAMGEPSEVLAMVAGLSAGACALFAIMQTNWSDL
jgi:CBS-domain-containing membrane protein